MVTVADMIKKGKNIDPAVGTWFSRRDAIQRSLESITQLTKIDHKAWRAWWTTAGKDFKVPE